GNRFDLTLNQRVQGSNPCAPTNKIKDLRRISRANYPPFTGRVGTKGEKQAFNRRSPLATWGYLPGSSRDQSWGFAQMAAVLDLAGKKNRLHPRVRWSRCANRKACRGLIMPL